jgi:hypothetical protein
MFMKKQTLAAMTVGLLAACTLLSPAQVDPVVGGSAMNAARNTSKT